VKLEHEFDVPASPEVTLDTLLDADRVVRCMPGARLVEVVDDRTWKTVMTVKLGPVGMDFANEVRLLQVDREAGTAKLGVRGRDTRGKGGADATIDAHLASLDGGGTRVAMATDLRFSGQAAQLGRPSVVQDVSTRIVDQFAECLRVQLEAEPGRAAPAAEKVQKPLSGFRLMWAALQGAVARLFRRLRGSAKGGAA
jgi:carbon monoxide dehydrogenase subunit G